MDEKTLEERRRWKKERIGQFYGKRISDQALKRHRAMQISMGDGTHWDIRILSAPDSRGSRRQLYRNRVKAPDGRRYANAMCTKYRIPFQNVQFTEDQQIPLEKDRKPVSMAEVKAAQEAAKAAAAAAKAEQQEKAAARKKAEAKTQEPEAVTPVKTQTKTRKKTSGRTKAKGKAQQG